MLNMGEVLNTISELNPIGNPRYPLNELGAGYLLADVVKETAHYVPERNTWYIYNGCKWEPDLRTLIMAETAKNMVNAMRTYGEVYSSPDSSLTNEIDQFRNFVKGKTKKSARETVIHDAKSVYPVKMERFDTDIFLFNCQNGTLNLKTGELLPHNPDDYITKVSGVAYDPEATCERWEAFIDEVTEGDKEKAVFLQKALGYSLTGDARYECFFILYGATSRNGKGTCMETMMHLMGDYGLAAKPESIAQKQYANGSAPSEDIARLAGARFVNMSEADQQMVLNSALVKMLTGNDTITARNLYESSFQFKPQFTLFMNTNYLPKVSDVTLFDSGRVKIIPFTRHFSEAERDNTLKKKLSEPEELSGILNWCLDGLRLLQQEGFTLPESIKKATDEYRKSSDKIARFIEDEMTAEDDAEASTKDTYERYKTWCYTSGHHPESLNNFKNMIEKVAEVKKKRPKNDGAVVSNPISMILGYKLNFA